jgi:hypothetical protein
MSAQFVSDGIVSGAGVTSRTGIVTLTIHR